jgi:hypothetical protein
MKTDEATQRRKAAILAALNEQLESSDTPEVQEQYDRLRVSGFSDTAVREMMAAVLATYLWHVMKQDDYTYADFVTQLKALPQVPWKE